MPGTRCSAAIIVLAIAGALAGCGEKSVTPPSCSFNVSGSTQAFSATGGAGSLTIATSSSCSWTAVSDSPWVTVGSASGTGAATIQFSVAANDATASRRATITVGGQAVPVNQDARAACEYAVSPSSLDIIAAGSAATLTVSAASGCAWTATSPDGWVAVGSPGAGSGNGTVSLAIQSNTATSERTSTLTVAGRPVLVRQAAASAPQPACEYSVSPVDSVVHWHATGVTLNISSSAGCSWTITTSDPWLSVDRGSGTGSATIFVNFSQFTEDATRRAAVQVRWPTPTAGQNSWVNQQGCRYGVAPSTSFPAAGGTTMVTVVTQPVSESCSIGCPWTAVSNASWIHVTSSMPRAGDDAFSYQVDANGGAARVGTITVAGKTHTVSQAGS